MRRFMYPNRDEEALCDVVEAVAEAVLEAVMEAVMEAVAEGEEKEMEKKKLQTSQTNACA